MRSGRSNSSRAVAVSLAVGINASLLLVLVFSRQEGEAEPEAGAMIWIVANIEPPPMARRPLPDASRRAMPGSNLPPLPAEPAMPGETALLPEGPPVAPSGSGSIDWYAEAAEAAQDAVSSGEPLAPEFAEGPDSEIHVRPESFWIPPKAGTVEPSPGGGTRIWTSDLCYRDYSMLESDPFTGRYRAGGREVCKTRSMAERLSEARAEAIADAVKRKRSKAQPVPRAPGSAVAVP